MVLPKKTSKWNFPGGNDGGLQAHSLKILTDPGRMIKLGGLGPIADAPISKPDLCIRFLCNNNLTYWRCIARISFGVISDSSFLTAWK